MSQDRAPAPGPDGAPVPAGPVTPDWVTDEDWDLICSSRTAADAPDDLDDVPEDPAEDGPPVDWASFDLAGFAAQAEADGAQDEALMARLLAAGVGEGYAHARGEPPRPGTVTGPAAGFGQGRCLDTALPGTGLSQLADEASGQDRAFRDVTDDQLLGVLSARARLESRAAWERLMAVAEFIRRRPEAGCPLAGPGRMPRVWQLSAVAELRAQLHLTPGAASAMLDLAHDLAAKLPRTSAALRDGIIDLARAQWMSWRCAPLSAAQARQVEDLIFGDPDAGEWTPGMWRDRVSAAVLQVDPDAARRRREASARQRRVEVRCEDSGNGSLAGRELPPAAVLAASQALTARARELRAAGLPGGMDELRVQAYLEKLGVLDPLAPAQPDPSAPSAPGGTAGDTPSSDPAQGSPGPGSDPAPGDGPGPSGGSSPSPAGGRGPRSGVAPGGFAARAHLTLPLATLLGLADRPGTLPGFGPIDPALVRDLAAAAARHPNSTWCLTITAPDGRPLAHGCGHPPPKHASPPRHTTQPPHPPPGTARASPGPRTIRLNPAAITGTPSTPGTGQDLIFTMHTLAGPCDHAHQATGHDPGTLLRHLTGILNTRCTFPPCRTPARTCDYEHSHPHHHGGRTCLCNAGPVCRRHHQDKQSPGWHLDDTGTRGWFRWTTPSGRTYTSRPTQYPH